MCDRTNHRRDDRGRPKRATKRDLPPLQDLIDTPAEEWPDSAVDALLEDLQRPVPGSAYDFSCDCSDPACRFHGNRHLGK
jgi:hypothetical protein